MTEDNEQQLGLLVVTHMGTALPAFQKYLVSRLQALYNKDFTVENSKREGYNFVSIHYHWYNRYSERVSLSCYFDQILIFLSVGQRCSNWGSS